MNIMANRKPDWSAWNRWCDSRIDARRDFDREVLVELIAELKAMIADQDEKLKAQAEGLRALDHRLTELARTNELRLAEERHTGVQLAEHQIAIAELRRMVNAERAKVIDLPEVPQRRGLN